MIRVITVTVCFLVIACTNNPVSSPTDQPINELQARPTISQQTPPIALLQLEQGFNDLDQYIVSGKIKNISESGVSGIQVKATLYRADGTLITSKSEYPDYWIGDLQPQGESQFSIKFYRYLDLDRQTPDPTRTVFDLLIDGYRVSYLNRAEVPYHSLFDFRFSNWGDDEVTVQSNEPNWLFLNHIDGGKSTKESEGYATATLAFSDTVVDTVEVAYIFRGGLLVAGWYDFAMTVASEKWDSIEDELTERYGSGVTVEGLDGVLGWTKSDQTFVFLYPATTWRGIRIGYIDRNASLDTESEDEYNRLPLRVVVPE